MIVPKSRPIDNRLEQHAVVGPHWWRRKGPWHRKSARSRGTLKHMGGLWPFADGCRRSRARHHFTGAPFVDDELHQGSCRLLSGLPAWDEASTVPL